MIINNALRNRNQKECLTAVKRASKAGGQGRGLQRHKREYQPALLTLLLFKAARSH